MKSVNALLATVALAVVATAATAAAANDDDKKMADFLTAALLQLKQEMPAGIPDLNIPPMDPHAMPDVTKDFQNSISKVTFALKDVSATGLSAFDPRSVSVSADGGKVEINLAFPKIGFSGDYKMSGTILGFPISGAGDADVAVMDVDGVVTAAIVVDAKSGVASLSGVETRLEAGSSLLMLQRFPSVDDVVEEVLRMLADALFLHLKPALEADMSATLTKALNAALALKKNAGVEVMSLDLPENRVYEAGNANGMLDNMISNARPAIAKKDPLALPEATKGFETKVLGIRVHGEAKFWDGFLAGIQTIHRTGDAEMTQPDMTTLRISANMGMNNLHGHYNLHAKLMNIGPTGSVSIKVTKVSCEIKVNVDLSKGKPKGSLQHFDITEIGKVELDFDGLGPLDWLINPLGGWVINAVKHKIADAVEGPLKKIIQEKMENVDIPIGF